jgi:hypothetical protein
MGVKFEEKKKVLQDLLHQIEEGKVSLLAIGNSEAVKIESQRTSIGLQRAALKADEEALNILFKEKTQGFPWLAKAYADYQYFKHLKEANYLETKAHPAVKAAEEVRRVANQRRIADELYRTIKYQLDYYENLFPWLIEFKEEDIDDLLIETLQKGEKGVSDVDEPDDVAKRWLTPSEYKVLPSAEKYQMALDRYWGKRKSKWEIGRDYERYIGYLYEARQFAVYYHGIVEGFADLGRDLICSKNGAVEVVQCKYWSKDKQIHEKHIFQLYGTMTAYKIDHPEQDISGSFVTSTNLSERAKKYADYLGIIVKENFPLDKYPCIKCNISRKDGLKIYHLPFDQQYDKTIIEQERNECYVSTVAEAEALGYRRAFRWKGEKQGESSG